VAVSATAGTSTAQGPETILAQAIPDGMYDRISFTVVDFTKLMLTDAVTDENVADTTLFDELQSQDNTLYVAEASNGTAELTIQGWWQPDDIDGDQFRWKVLLTNEANEATATTTHWAPDNNGTFTMNPQTLTWTSNTVSGLPDRTFKILGWYDCNGNGVYDSDEPHRLLYVSVYNFQIVWAQRNSPWKVADYTAAQSVHQPLGGQVGQPGGEGGFGGPPTGSEFGRLSDPFTVKNYELIDNGSGSSRTLKLTMLSNVSAWSNDYVLTEQGVNSDIFSDEEDGLAVRRVLEQNVADSAKGLDRETVLMASVAFGAERIMTVYKPQNGSVYEAERVTVEIEMSALPATNVADTITVTVVSSLRPGLVETGVLVETSVDSLVFARSDGELKMQIVRITDKDATGADDLTAVLSSKALEISGSTVDAMETGAKSLVFRTDAISASGGAIETGAKSLVFRIDAISASGGAAGTGGGASSYVAIGAIWVPLGAIAKDKVGQPTFPGYWQGTTLRAQVTRRRGMILEDYPNDLEWSKAAEQPPPAGASTDCKYYTFAPLKIFHVIDDDGATPVFSDVLPFLPIIPGLPALLSVTRVKAKGGDILKAEPVGHAEPYDEVTVINVDITDAEGSGAAKYEIATLPDRQYINKWSAKIEGIDDAGAVIKYERAGTEAVVAWAGTHGDVNFTDGDLNVEIALLDGSGATPVMTLDGNLLKISAIQQGDKIIVEEPSSGCRDQLAVVKNFSWNDLQRLGPANLAMSDDFAGIPAQLKANILDAIKFCLDPQDTSAQATQREALETALAGTGLCTLNVPSARGVGPFPDDMGHFHLAASAAVPGGVTTAVNDLETESDTQTTTLGIDFATSYQDKADRTKFAGHDTAVLNKLKDALTQGSGTTDPFLIYHTYEIVNHDPYIDVGALMKPGDPIRNIKTAFGADAQLFAPPDPNNASSWLTMPNTFNIVPVNFVVNKNGKVVVLYSAGFFGAHDKSLLIRDALNE
jgi:hypothetical protein